MMVTEAENKKALYTSESCEREFGNFSVQKNDKREEIYV